MEKIKLILLLFCILLCAPSCKKTENKEQRKYLEEAIVVEITEEDRIHDNPTQEPGLQQEEKIIKYKFLYDEFFSIKINIYRFHVYSTKCSNSA